MTGRLLSAAHDHVWLRFGGTGRQDAALERRGGMRNGMRLSLAFVAAMALVAVSFGAAKEITLSGKVQCALCVLKKADAKSCQDVLVVTGQGAGEYYIAKNAVSEKYQHKGCAAAWSATVTGSVSTKDGQRWIAPTKMAATP
jgi:hypothetical protein